MSEQFFQQPLGTHHLFCQPKFVHRFALPGYACRRDHAIWRSFQLAISTQKAYKCTR